MTTKRLRGWSLQKELSSSAPEPKPSTESPLASKLLSLWAHGALSATLTQELAHLAILDGASHPELAALSKAGNFGEIKGNVHRDIVAQFCKDIKLEGFDMKTTCVDPKTSLLQDTKASLFLPHVMFSTLAKEYPEKFSKLFCVESLESFWLAAEKTDDDRIRGHPMTSRSDWRQKVVPFFVHGDGVEFQSRDSLMVWSFGSVLSLFESLDSHKHLGTLLEIFCLVFSSPAVWQTSCS